MRDFAFQRAAPRDSRAISVIMKAEGLFDELSIQLIEKCMLNSESETTIYVLRTERKAVVGTCWVDRPRYNPKLAHIGVLAIKRSLQRQGWGTWVLQTIEKWLKDKEIATACTSEELVPFWEKSGFAIKHKGEGVVTVEKKLKGTS